MGKIKKIWGWLTWKLYRGKRWNTMVEVRGKVIDPYSYLRGFEDGMAAMNSPIMTPTMKILSDEDAETLRKSWRGVMNSPNIKVSYMDDTR